MKEFDFSAPHRSGLLICAGGFEDRAAAFAVRLRKKNADFEDTVLIHYDSQQQDNEQNFLRINARLKDLAGKIPHVVSVDANRPLLSFETIKKEIKAISQSLKEPTAIVDISGMTNLWALAAIHGCLASGLNTTIALTEARWYFPLKRDKPKLLKAWVNDDYQTAERYLQSAALKTIDIVPEFGGNFRPGRQTCLMVFVGYEPNRVTGLVDDYAPGALVVLYGKSPHSHLEWRTQLSKDLHKSLFSNWHVREIEVSTLEVEKILGRLEGEFQVIREYDVAIAPQCSKMQALATYLFWRRHPEIQILFTAPVRFNPFRYSRGAGRTHIYKIT